METMRFHWVNENDESQRGFFNVTAPTVEKCIEIAEQQIDTKNFYFEDYYSV